MVSANGTVIDNNIPSPQGYSVPLNTISHVLLFLSYSGTTFLTSNLFLPSEPVSAPDFADLTTPFDFAGAEGPASGISTSAMVAFTIRSRLRVRISDPCGQRNERVQVTVSTESRQDMEKLREGVEVEDLQLK